MNNCEYCEEECGGVDFCSLSCYNKKKQIGEAKE